MPAIEFTDYARLQMAERELSEDLVREALAQPAEVVTGQKGRKVAHKRWEPVTVTISFGLCLKSRKISGS